MNEDLKKVIEDANKLAEVLEMLPGIRQNYSITCPWCMGRWVVDNSEKHEPGCFKATALENHRTIISEVSPNIPDPVITRLWAALDRLNNATARDMMLADDTTDRGWEALREVSAAMSEATKVLKETSEVANGLPKSD